MTRDRAEAVWVVVACWLNSADTVHGPWLFAEHAEDFAGQVLEPDRACTGWRVDILQPDNR